MKKYLANSIAILLITLNVYTTYSLINYLTKYVFGLGRFSSNEYVQLYTFLVCTATLLFIIAGILFFMKKKFSIIIYWIAVVIPVIVTVVIPNSEIPVMQSYLVYLLNAIGVAFLSTQWNKMSQSQ